MRIGIQTWGSEGDISLGGVLSEARHRVTVVITDLDDRDYSSVFASMWGLAWRRTWLGYSNLQS